MNNKYFRKIASFRRSEQDSAQRFWNRFSSADTLQVMVADKRDPFYRLIEKERPTFEILQERARQKVLYHAPQALPVLQLIIKNGENRKESIWQLMQKIKNSKRRKTNTTATGRR